MTRRTALALLATSLARAAGRLPANKNVRWALGANLWNSFPRVLFTDILDVMKDTGFIGIRMTQFPQILKTYNITVPELQKELSKRGCQIITISYNGPAHDPARPTQFTARLDAMKDTGFVGIRMTQFPQILKPSNIRVPELRICGNCVMRM